MSSSASPTACLHRHRRRHVYIGDADVAMPSAMPTQPCQRRCRCRHAVGDADADMPSAMPISRHVGAGTPRKYRSRMATSPPLPAHEHDPRSPPPPPPPPPLPPPPPRHNHFCGFSTKYAASKTSLLCYALCWHSHGGYEYTGHNYIGHGYIGRGYIGHDYATCSADIVIEAMTIQAIPIQGGLGAGSS